MEIIRRRGRWREDLPGSAWRWLLLPAWGVYRAGVAFRNAAFDLGLRHPVHLTVPVISVGNLIAGGTGKTPLARLLARRCRERGQRPAILSRGYRGRDAVNDEALLVEECPVVCDPDRAAGGRRAAAAGATCLILDDGFQHRQFHRDLDLVLIDATRPWGGGVLPLGYAREGREALKRAHALVMTRQELVTPVERLALEGQLAAFGKPLIRMMAERSRLEPLQGGIPADPGVLQDRPVLLASGLGNPQGFERCALRHGWRVVASLRFPDHHRYDRADADLLAAEAGRRGATLVITAKDAVKLAPLLAPEAPCWVLKAEAAVAEADRSALDGLLDQVLERGGTTVATEMPC